MTDFTSLQKKVNALKALVAANSITPTYLGALLDDFISQMKAIDMTGMSDDVATALRNSTTALSQAQQALTKAGDADDAAKAAVKTANAADDKAASARESASSALEKAGTALDQSNAAISKASEAAGNASSALAKATSNAESLAELYSMIGKALGLAPLDANGLIPSAYLPSFVDDVIEFNATVEGVAVSDGKSGRASTDSGALVVYDSVANRYLLAYSSLSASYDRADWENQIVRPQLNVAAPLADDDEPVKKLVASDFWLVDMNGTLALDAAKFTYYSDWEDADSFGDYTETGRKPQVGKVHVCTSTNKTYRWSGSALVTIGSDLALGHTSGTAFPGDEGDQLQVRLEDLEDTVNTKVDVYDFERVERLAEGVAILPFNGFVPNENVLLQSADGIYFVNDKNLFGTPGHNGPEYPNPYNNHDRIGTPTTPSTEYIFRNKAILYRFDSDQAALVEVGGGSATGNVINIHEITGDWNATNRGAAALLVPDKLRTGGRKITFMYAAGKWQTWQFVGSLVSDWNKETFWRQEVRSVSINKGEPQAPDAEGNVDVSFDVPIDQTMNAESERAVANKAVVGAINEVAKSIPHSPTFDANTRILSWYNEDGELAESVMIPGGGGGGVTNPTAVEITIQSPTIATVKEGDDYVIEYLWRHYNINTNVDTQYGGTAELIVSGAVVDRKVVAQGFDSFNVGPWLQSGLNTVRIRITADDGLVSQSANIKITAAALSLRSLYDISTANIIGSPITMRYIVNGSGEKKVAFTMDGNDLGTETISTSGSTSIKTVQTTGMYHSVRTVTMQATRDIGAAEPLRTDALSFDVMVINKDSYKPLIALSRTATAKQYSTVEIPFAVYDPCNSLGAVVEIYLGDELIQSQLVDRSLHTFSYRVKKYGEMTFTFKVKNNKLSTENSVTVDVIKADTQIDAETDGLALYLSASGRSNDAENRADWSFTSEAGVHTAAQFINCGFDAQSGWKKDVNGITALHLEKGAQVYIPFAPFASDAKLVGKTLEIEFMVSDCFDMYATIISCLQGNVGFEIKAQEAYLSSALKQTVGTKFKQNERLRVGFTIDQVSGTNRFVHLFVNGKHSGVVQYDTNDYFVQNPPVGITLGHASCKLDAYNIRVYENALTFRQMLNNFIADMDDTTVMFAKLAANDILNEESAEGEIDFAKAVMKIACLRYIGELPKFKGDKKTGLLVYEDPFHPEDNFSVVVQIDVQGTSSQYYVVKNWKVKAKDLFQMSTSGTTAKKFALRAYDSNGNEIPQKPVKTFCLKADFAESSGTHNTGAANMIDEILKATGIKTPMQEIDDTVRTTVYGHPVLLFHQDSQSSPIRFVGKYNFNNDKSTHDTFGFQDIPGFNKGMVNRDDYLVWEGSLASLQGNAEALAAAEDAEVSYYLIENGSADPMTNHLVEYDSDAGAWKDKGEMWRWNAHLRAWAKRNGSTCTRAEGILAKVDAGELVENNIECWEFLNNGHPMCLFHTSDYTSQVRQGMGDWVKDAWLKSDADGKYAPYWTGAFEARYPDNDDNNRQYARGRIPEQLKRVTDWLASLSGIVDANLSEAEKNAKAQLFAGEIDSYFNRRMALAYDIIRQGFVAADQGAKNMMWAIIDGLIYIIFYDNDTIWLINNEGRIMFIPYVEPHSKDSLGKFVFNGESSVLWNGIERGMQSEQRALYNDMVAAGFTYEKALFWFNERQSDQWCEAVYNADSKYKYIDSFGKESEDGSGATNNYLDMAQGSREEHRKWAMYERFQYQNAKFGAGSFRESRIYLRVNTAGESTVPAKVEVDVTAAQDWYFAFRFAANSGWNPVFVSAGETKRFSAPEGSNPNDTESYIHQADRISDIGDISPLYPTTCDIAQARMLRQLVVGNKTAGYRGKLATLTLGSHPLLTYINVCNIPTLASSLNLLGCSALERIEAQGSAITGINLPAGSGIKAAHLPATVVQLEFDRLPNLTNANLVVDGYANVQTVNITDCTHLNPMAVLDAITATPGNALQYIRVTGGTLRGTGEELIRLINLGVHGVNNRNGLPEVLGTYHMTKLPVANELDIILSGINPDGFTVELVVEAFTDAMDEVNAESYNSVPEVEDITIDNVGDHILYYNGETAEEALARLAAENRDIHQLILL